MSLARNFATVGGSTLTSRLLGFARDMLMAAALGTGPVADAFLVAFRLPNLFRRLFAEGAFAAAFIPLFVRRIEEEGSEAAARFAGEALSGLMFIVTIVILAGELLMTPIVALLAPGFSADPDKFALAVLLTRIALPYLGFLSLLALYGGILNARGRFLAAAIAPTLLNIVLIAALAYVLLGGKQQSELAGVLLATATLAGGGLQLGLVVLAARRAGIGVPLLRPRLTPGLRRLARLALPGLVGGGVTQINGVIGTVIASFAPGAIAVLGYADRLYQLPLGIVGATIAVVVLPDLSRHLRAGDAEAAASLQNRSLEFAMALTLPASIGLFVLAEPIVRIIFERGAFDAADTSETAQVLMGYSVGLPAFVLIKVFSPAFFAREDTATPMWVAVGAVIVNTVGSVLLFPRLGAFGIAIATSVAGWLNAGALAILLSARRHLRPDARLARSLPLILFAASVMGIVCGLAASWADAWLFARGVRAAAALAVLCMGGAALFGGFLHFSGVFDGRAAMRALKRRRR